MTKHQVTVSFQLEVECEDPKHIASIVAEHQPYVNAAGNQFGGYSMKSKMKSTEVIKIN